MNRDGSTGGAGTGPGSGSGSGSGSTNTGGGAGTGPSKTALVSDTWFRIGVVAGAVGALLLVTHYFEPFLLLAALPTKQWRAAALTSDLASLALKPPVRLRRDPRRPDLLRGGAG